MSEPRGLHSETGLQRKRGETDWARPQNGHELEKRDAPFGAVGKGLGWIGAGLIGAIVLVLTVARIALPGPGLSANVAHARFRTAGPSLLRAPQEALRANLARHPSPSGRSLDRAMGQVVAQGWGDEAPPPGRADVAMARARAGQ
jgi:hypothetical protein